MATKIHSGVAGSSNLNAVLYAVGTAALALTSGASYVLMNSANPYQVAVYVGGVFNVLFVAATLDGIWVRFFKPQPPMDDPESRIAQEEGSDQPERR